MGAGEEVETEFYIRVLMRYSHCLCLFPLCGAEVNEVLSPFRPVARVN